MQGHAFRATNWRAIVLVNVSFEDFPKSFLNIVFYWLYVMTFTAIFQSTRIKNSISMSYLFCWNNISQVAESNIKLPKIKKNFLFHPLYCSDLQRKIKIQDITSFIPFKIGWWGLKLWMNCVYEALECKKALKRPKRLQWKMMISY